MNEPEETRPERRERLHRAAGEAIRRAAEAGGDPVEIMIAATGEEAKYCDPCIRQHPLFLEMRGRFLMPEERRRRSRRRATRRRWRPSPAWWCGSAGNLTTGVMPPTAWAISAAFIGRT